MANGDSGNLGEYKVVVSADYANLIRGIEELAKRVEVSANSITSLMDNMAGKVGKSFGEVTAAMRSTVEQSNQLNTLSNATSNAGKAAETTAEKYKSLQKQLQETRTAAEKSFGTAGFDTAKSNYEAALAKLEAFKTAIGDNREAALRAEQKTQQAIEQTARMRQQAISDMKAAQNAQSNKQYWIDEEAGIVKRSQQLQSQMQAAQNIANQKAAVAKQEQAEIQRLGTQYENLYRRIASYIDSNTKLSAQMFTKMKADMEVLQGSLAAKNVSPVMNNPLANFNSYDEYAAGFNKVSDAIKNTTKNTNILSDALSKMRSHILWMASATISGAIFLAPFEAVKNIADIEQQMAGMIQTLPQLHNNQSALNSVTKDFINIAEKYGMEVDKIIEAGKLWSRGYKDVADVMALTGASAKLAVADMMDVTLANRAVESVISGFGRQAEAVSFATHVVDSWTNVAHNTQASATDLAEALMRSAAAAHVVGLSFDTTTALAATMIKTTGQSGSIVGNALKSIFSSIHSDKAIKDLQALGVQVYNFDQNGTAHFRNVASVITDLMLKVHETSQDMQKDLEHIAGGKFQWGRAAAMFGNYADFIKDYNLSIGSTGFSEGQIAAQMDTINRKIQQVKASWDGLLTGAGNSGLSQFIKGSLDNINSFLKGLQQIPSGVYQVVGNMALLGGGLYATSKAFSFINAGITGLKTAYAEVAIAKTADTVATGTNTAVQTGNAIVIKNVAGSLVAESVAMEVDTLATNVNTAAKGRLAVATTIATGGMNLIVAALTAAAVGGSMYAASLGSASSASDNAMQKNADLIAVKQQELEMNQKQVEFIGTLGESYNKLRQDLDNVGNDEKKSIQIKKDMQATEDELAKIVGIDAAKRITHSEDINAAIAHEQEVHTEKGKDIKIALNNLKATQKELRDNAIKYCNDRIDAINNEARDFEKAANAIGKALGTINEIMYRYYSAKASWLGNVLSDLEQNGNNTTFTGQFMGNMGVTGVDADTVRNIYNETLEKKASIADQAKQVIVQESPLGGHFYPDDSNKNTGPSTIGGDETTPYAPKDTHHKEKKVVDNSPERLVHDALKDAGLSEELIAGILGNIQAESNFNPLAKNQGHYGIVQWDADRWADLEKFAAENMSDPWSLSTQAAFIPYELKHKESESLSRIYSSGASSAKEFAAQIDTKYERSGNVIGNENNRERQKHAQRFYDRFALGEGKEQLSNPQKRREKQYEELHKIYEEELQREKNNFAEKGKFFSAKDELALFQTKLGTVGKGLPAYETELIKLQLKSHDEQIKIATAKYEQEAAIATAGADKIKSIEAEIKKKVAAGTQLSGFEQSVYTQMQIAGLYPAGSFNKYEANTKEYKIIAEQSTKQAEIIKSAASTLKNVQFKQTEFDFKNHLISQPQMNDFKTRVNQETYDDAQSSVEKQLRSTAMPGKENEMIAKYKQYLEEKDTLRKQALLEDMVALAKFGQDVTQTVKTGQQSWAEYYQKRQELEQETFNYIHRYELAGINAFQSGIEKSLSGIIDKTMSWADAMRNIFSSLGKAIEQQWINDLAAKWTQTLAKMIFGQQQADQKILSETASAEGAKQGIRAAGNTKEVAETQTTATTKVAINKAADNAIKTSSTATSSAVSVDLGKMTVQMLEMMAIMYAISALFGGGGSSTKTSTASVSLGRSPTSYYSTPTNVPSINVPSFDVGAFELPSDMYARVHAGESILPKPFAEEFRAAIRSGSFSGNSNGINTRSNLVSKPQININASAIDGRGMKHALNGSSRDVANALRREYRRFNKSINGK